MLIGEIAKRTGFSTDTIRWYEKIGLIKLDRKTRGENNYRMYDQQTLERLLVIKQIKALGFTLKEVEQLLFLDEIDELECAPVGEILQHRLKKIEEKIAELQLLQSKLIGLKTICTGDCGEAMRIVSKTH